MISKGPLLFLCAYLFSGATAFSGSQTSTRTDTPLHESSNRRTFLASAVVPAVALWSVETPTAAAATDSQSLLRDLETTRTKLDPIPRLIQNQEWDQVRTILKTPPVNFLWNMGDSKNPIQLLALELDELDLIEAKDEIAISLQMCDQLVYDNVFLPFQPGNGKINIKEPSDLAQQAMKQMDDAIRVGKAAATAGP